MHDYGISVFLGIVEGLTEFLPVSSTAHLRICEAWLGMDLSNGYWKMFAIVIQLGAILTLPIYFRARIANLIATFPRGIRDDRNIVTHPLTLTLIAFVLTAVPALLLTKVIGKHLESLYLMGASLVVGGVVMWIVDELYAHGMLHNPERRTDDMDRMSLSQAAWVGICQIASAVFPGTSRSMATIAAGQLVGMTRSAALEFSFFLSIPTMVAATGYDLFKSMRLSAGGQPIGAAPTDVHGWIVLLVGFAVSFVVAYGVVAWFMAWVRRRGFVPFAVYRILFGILVLVWAFTAFRP